MTSQRFAALLTAFRNKRTLVVGDLMLDEFVWGSVSRISPEAPVPVVHVDRESWFPGGAANVARNLREFSDDVRVMAQIGTDAHGAKLKGLLADHGIALDWLHEDPAYQTIVKTRIIARHQQVVRVDREKKAALTPLQKEKALAQFSEMLPALDAIIFEDYGKGLLDQELVDEFLRLAKAACKIVTVDPNPRNALLWHDISGATPNRSEAFAAAGEPHSEPVNPPLEDEALLRVGAKLLAEWSAAMLLITLGEHGMMLFSQGGAPFHIPTQARDVFDVSGAGDTAIALFTLALASGATGPEAAEVSNHAAGIVVGKLGTATVQSDELAASFAD